jgi:hypothetical protein
MQRPRRSWFLTTHIQALDLFFRKIGRGDVSARAARGRRCGGAGRHQAPDRVYLAWRHAAGRRL